MGTGTIGIIIPVYNTDGAYLDESIASARAQTVACPIVVVDDGSTNPSTVDALARWSDRGVHVVRHPENRGTSVALDSGAAALDTDYLMPMGSDDRILPSLCAEVAAVLDADESVGIVSTDLRFFGSYEGVDRLPATDGVADILFGNTIPGASAFRRSDWVALGGFATGLRFGQDWEFWVRLLASGRTARVVHRPLYEYRRHAAQVTATMTEDGKLTHSLDVVRRNSGIWGAHVEEIMARYWKLADEHTRQSARLDVLERRYGALNRLLGRAARFVKSLRPRWRR
ncbi:glycosyltransferase [Microbacterium aurantiacum]|uniref:glycosyltransferase n=1 Tax=Microbacterium aurantiacum TaxID=162393 RepID=UPI000C80C732|nr:glycosyltransferase [Microbacterium aurantiacum]